MINYSWQFFRYSSCCLREERWIQWFLKVSRRVLCPSSSLGDSTKLIHEELKLNWCISLPNLPCAVPPTGRFGQSSPKTKPLGFNLHQRAASESSFLVLNWCLWKRAPTHYPGQGNTVLSNAQPPICGHWRTPKYHIIDQICFSGLYQRPGQAQGCSSSQCVNVCWPSESKGMGLVPAPTWEQWGSLICTH